MNNDWFRADGDCLCPVCEKEYRKHPFYLIFPWLNILCNGWLVKL